jgi:uncharacterized membrane protein YhiD involved in acid resistance
VILRDARARSVEGLTTAATVWVAAALGIAAGLAAWTVLGIGLVFAIIALVAVGWTERLFSRDKDDPAAADAGAPGSTDRGGQAERS